MAAVCPPLSDAAVLADSPLFLTQARQWLPAAGGGLWECLSPVLVAPLPKPL